DRDGKYSLWYENGQMERKETYKNGGKDGLETWRYENGQKGFEGTWKDFEINGKWTYWSEDGEKWKEEIYKDGELTSEKCWDWDGNEIDCLLMIDEDENEIIWKKIIP
ncbi:MAG TPA: hypothetical protein EYM60_03980, partial [Candidatus Marinimicrobia bacterium]|nr:hypothetical protein [Candidatus Neomarinimicrobiota bacterium]